MDTIRSGTDTVDLLSDLAHLLNLFGPGSPEVETFVGEHEDNPEFIRLGRLSCALKQALTADASPSSGLTSKLIDVRQLSPSLGKAIEEDQATITGGAHEDGDTRSEPSARRLTCPCPAH